MGYEVNIELFTKYRKLFETTGLSNMLLEYDYVGRLYKLSDCQILKMKENWIGYVTSHNCNITEYLKELYENNARIILLNEPSEEYYTDFPVIEINNYTKSLIETQSLIDITLKSPYKSFKYMQIYFICAIIIVIIIVTYYKTYFTTYINKTKEIKRKIKTKIYKQTSIGDICSICLEDLTNSEIVSDLKCGHFFHEECLNKWTSVPNGESCPNCKKRLFTNELEEPLIDSV